MFMFPEPPPLDYYIADVSRIFLSDGIFHNGKASATHKYVAKQLKPIKRTLNDPIAPPQKLDPSFIDWMLVKRKEGYVDHAGKDKGIIFQTLGSMPKWKRDRKKAQESVFSVFPRSSQYELSSIHDRQSKNSERCKTTTVERPREEEVVPVEPKEDPCYFLTPPVWWKGKTGKPCKLPVGNINDYMFERETEKDMFDTKISEKLQMDHPMRYMPGDIHRIKNPTDTNMKDVLERADAFKVTLGEFDTSPEDNPPVVECVCPPDKSPGESKTNEELPINQTLPCDYDLRWQPLSKSTDFLANGKIRTKELRKLTKPFQHELHMWYSTNKPTKLIEPVRQTGKRPAPDRRFSHL